MTPGHRGRLARIAALLEARNGTRTPPGGDPVGQLVRTILSQQTTSASCRAAWIALRGACPDWESVRALPAPRLEALIRPAGLAARKARHIQAVLGLLEEAFGSVTLDPMATMGTEEATAFLESLPGVGPKTAACVLCFSLGRDVLPVDTHVARIGRRLGLVGDSVPKGREHAALRPLVPQGRAYQLHVDLFELGRSTCHARHPRCDECPLLPLCDTGRGRR